MTKHTTGHNTDHTTNPTAADHAALALELFKRVQFTGAELPQAVAVHNWLSGFLPPANGAVGTHSTAGPLSRPHTPVPGNLDG